MDEVVRAMHTRSGLLAAIEASTLTLDEAGAQTLAFLKQHIPEAGTVPLAGNSIGTDRRFLAAQLPEIEDYLHYRSVDVSTVKELCRRWHPEVYRAAPDEEGRPPGPAGHPRERRRAGLLPHRHLRPRRNSGQGDARDAPRTGDTPSCRSPRPTRR